MNEDKKRYNFEITQVQNLAEREEKAKKVLNENLSHEPSNRLRRKAAAKTQKLGDDFEIPQGGAQRD